ncbi:MAG: DUF5011 domain-containing protein [Bacteroidota bacterium]
MKKQILAIAAVAFVAGAVMMSGCKKEDTTAPVITLTGGDQTQSLPSTAGNGTWTEPGFTAEDDEDGNVTANVDVSGTVNPNRKGSYVITYTVSDKAGNQASVTRTVTIVNDAEYLAGSYPNSTDSCAAGGGPFSWSTPNFPDVYTSDSVNNLIKINNFGAFGESINIWATVSGTNLTFSLPQSLGGTANLTSIYTTTPNPTAITSTTAPTAFTVKYQWNDGVNNDVCVSWYRR